jgi:hypothetical protein
MADMVTAEVKGFVYLGPSPVDEPPRVDDPDHFGMQVTALIGAAGESPGDAFSVHLCTASWLAAELVAGRWLSLTESLVTEDDESVGPLAGVWLMERWSQEGFEAAVQRLCVVHSPAPDWGTLAARIGRVMPWEYDYRYDDFVDAHPGPTFPPGA